MTCFSLKIIRTALCLIIMLPATAAKAQIALVQDLLTKMEGYQNFSYQSVSKLRDMSADTTVAFNQELFLKAPGDQLCGYFYRIKTDHQTEDFHRTDLYGGDKVTILSASDRTFFFEKAPFVAYSRSLVGALKFIRDRYAAKPFNIRLLADTLINGKATTHFVAEVYDELDHNEHLFSYRHYYIDKQTALPARILITGRYKYNGLVSNYYSETSYSGYKVNQPGITAADFAIPVGYRLRKDTAQPSLLTQGTMAPDWTLTDVNGKAVSLSQLKGKVVVLDFYFIGCSGCMLSLKPMNAIYEKFKNKDVVIASLTERDSKKAVIDFEKRYQINYPGLINAAEVVKAYQVTAFPTFYFIDKEGKIGYSIIGYNDKFEQQATSFIGKLLK